MTDPFADVRKLLKRRWLLTRSSPPFPKERIEALVNDADALFVLRGTLLRMSHMVDSGGTWEAVDAAVMHEMAETALATLPEHLR